MAMSVTIGFIGFGNMAQAMAKGLLAVDAIKPENVFASAKHYDTLSSNASALGINACESNGAAVRAVHRVGLDGSPGRWVAIAFRVPSDLLDEIGVFRVHGCHIRCVRGIGESPRGQGEDGA